jgi:hypothetical protein
MSDHTAAGRRFTLDEANALLPVVRQLTDEAAGAAQSLTDRLHETPPGDEQHARIESSLSDVVARWSQQIEELGLEPKGLWLVDFDTGDGYYCWKHPEPAITHYHGYAEGFAGRMKIV